MKEICKKRGVIMKINWTEVKGKIRPQIIVQMNLHVTG
ncbi:hypothetical protein bcere0021_25440 [Bacillus cereus Rock3-42]|nr:hypothetical protein bcere0021_25440 [Bacillus cereus Rock3-42]